MALKLNRPPNTCMPSNAKIIMKRKRRSSREAMDWMELRSDATRLDSDRQYLEEKRRGVLEKGEKPGQEHGRGRRCRGGEGC